MSRFLLLCVGIALCAALTLTPAAAMGQEADGNETSVEIDAVTIDQNETAVEQVDDYTTLMDWEYNDDREGFELVFRSDRSQGITITEAVQFSEGSGQGRIYQNRVPSGTAEVFVPVPRRGGEAAVTLVTPQSLQENRFTYVSTGQQEPERPALNYERVRLMVLLTAFGTAAFVFRVVRKKRNDETKEVERIL